MRYKFDRVYNEVLRSFPDCDVRPAIAEPAESFSAEPYVIRHAGTVVHMYADGTGEQTETMSVAVQSEGAVRQFSVSNW